MALSSKNKMNDSSTDDLLFMMLTISVPLAIRYIWDFYRKRNLPKVPEMTLPPHPFSKWDLMTNCFIVAAAAFYLSKIIHLPFNFFEEIGVDLTAPSYQIRNHFRDYMVSKYPGWVLGPLGDSPSANLFDKEVYDNEIKPWEDLYDKLRIGRWRRWYGR